MVRITADDFFEGLFAALAQKGFLHISIRNEQFDKAVAPLFQKLQGIALDQGLDLRFRIRLHEFHDDSATVRDAIYSAAQRGLISLDNPEYQDIRLKIGREHASRMLARLPGGSSLFLMLASDLLKDPNLMIAT